MNVTTQQRSGMEIMGVDGRIDSSTAPIFEAAMLKWVEAPGSHYILDITSVTFMSSAALRVLLTMAKRTSRNAKKITLAGPTPEVRDIFAIANFDAVFSIVATVEEAITAVG